MIRIAIPPEDLAILQEERYPHPHPRVQRKLHTLYWVGLGYPRHDAWAPGGVWPGSFGRRPPGVNALRCSGPYPRSRTRSSP